MKSKLHILFLNSWYPSRVLPTSGDFIQRHAEAVSLNNQVTAVHIISDANIKKKIEISDKNINDVRTIIAYLKLSSNPIIKVIRFYSAFVKIIKINTSFDLVHLNVTFPAGIFALYLKWIKHKPFIISEHWTDYQNPLNEKIGFFRKFVTKIIIKNAVFVCPVTKHLQKAMYDFGLIGRYYPVPNVVDTNMFKPSETIRINFTITHISNMDNNHKNVKGLLNVISKLQTKIPNLKLNLIGENAEKYRQFSKEILLKNINFINHIPHKQIATYLNNSDVFVLFSNYENLPCVILEAFACGVPVISTNVGGINEYFPSEFGYLIPPKNEKKLAQAILNIADGLLIPNKVKMHKYAQQHFSNKSIAYTFYKLYTQSLTGKKDN